MNRFDEKSGYTRPDGRITKSTYGETMTQSHTPAIDITPYVRDDYETGQVGEPSPTPWAVRGKIGFAGFGVNDANGRSVFAIPSNGTNPHRAANAAVAVVAVNNHDALVAALRDIQDLTLELHDRNGVGAKVYDIAAKALAAVEVA